MEIIIAIVVILGGIAYFYNRKPTVKPGEWPFPAPTVKPTEEVKVEEIKIEEVKAEEVKAEEVKVEEVKVEEVKPVVRKARTTVQKATTKPKVAAKAATTTTKKTTPKKPAK